MLPADKATSNVVFVCRLQYIHTQIQELSGTKAYRATSEEDLSVVLGHCNHLALKFSVTLKEQQDKLPTMYDLPKIHKIYIKARFIVSSSFCITTGLSESCLTAIKTHVIRYCACNTPFVYNK